MANPTEQSDNCYVPDPRYTFIFLPDPDVYCIICKDSKLTLPSGPGIISTQDKNPALLPCGHVFGEECLRTWLKTNNTCPICRFKLTHELCDHPINPFQLTMEDVLFAPRTIPNGGSVGAQCHYCTRQTIQHVISELCLSLVKLFYEVKLRHEQTASREDEMQMAMIKRDLDNIMEAHTPPEYRQW